MIALIVAMDAEGTIGRENDLPWHFPKDLAYFKETTKGKKVLMGRKTYESIKKKLGRPLPKRENLVVSRSLPEEEGIAVIRDLEGFLAGFPKEDELFVIGGRTVYEAALPHCDYLYITHIAGRYEGDTRFPDYDKERFELVKKVQEPPLVFAVYRRKEDRDGD